MIPPTLSSWCRTAFPFTRARVLASALKTLLVVLLVASDVLASFEELPTGGRAAGLADAYTAIADDVYSSYYNPAGLVQLHRPEFSAYYARLYAGLTDGSTIGRSFVAYGQPIRKRRAAVGVSYLSLSLAGLYSESTIAATYAQALGDRWNVGTSFKLLRKSFGSDQYTQNAINSDTGASLGAPDPLFAQNGTSKSGVSLDIGAQYRLSHIYDLGVAVLNVNSPNMALSTSDSDKVSPVYKIGMARRTKTSAIDAEISERQFTSNEYHINVGAERWLSSGIGIRGGLGFGDRSYQITSLGCSYRWDIMEIDYAFIYSLTGIQGTFGSHQLSLTFRFGKKE